MCNVIDDEEIKKIGDRYFELINGTIKVWGEAIVIFMKNTHCISLENI